MATNNTGNGPAALEPKVIQKLLDLLSSDDEFRSLFEQDPGAALAQAGHKPAMSAPMTTGLAVAPSAGACLQMGAGDSLASKESIESDRAKLELALSKPFTFTCPAALVD